MPSAGMRIGMAAGMIAQARARALDRGRILAIARHRVIFGIHADGWARSPLVQSAQKAVGMPPEPSSTVKPSRRSRSTYQAAD